MILFQYLIPEIIIVSSACFILIIDLFLKENYKEISYYLIQASLIITIITIFERYDYFINLKPFTYNTEIFATIFKVFLLTGMVAIFHYSYNFLKYFQLYKTEYFILCLFAVTGMMIMSSAEDLSLIHI